jgi:hypothetical protein
VRELEHRVASALKQRAEALATSAFIHCELATALLHDSNDADDYYDYDDYYDSLV